MYWSARFYTRVYLCLLFSEGAVISCLKLTLHSPARHHHLLVARQVATTQARYEIQTQDTYSEDKIGLEFAIAVLKDVS